MDRRRKGTRMAARREAASMGTNREVAHMANQKAAHMAVGREVVRSRRQQAVAGRRQPLEPHNLAHKMRGESQPFPQIRT
jgi:hypothetical protein